MSLTLCKAVIAFIFSSTFLGCVDIAEPPVFEQDPAGIWIKGDFHVHSTGASNDTGGDSWPSAIRQMAIARGLDFVVLTDHSNSTGSDPSTTEEDPALFNMGPEFPYWDSAAILSDAGFLMIDGNEISPVQSDATFLNPTGHIACIPRDPAGFDQSVIFTDRPQGTVTGGMALQQALDAGCFTILFHPYAAAPWIRYDWTAYDYEGMEIWNGTGGYDEFDMRSRKAWICDLLQGRNVIPVGGSDCHRVNTAAPGFGTDPALGYPSTWVFAESLSWSGLVNGLENGRVSIGEEGSMVYLDGYDADGKRTGNAPAYIRVRGAVSMQSVDPVLRVTATLACDDPRPDHLSDIDQAEVLVLEKPLNPGTEFDFNEPRIFRNAVYTAEITTANAHYRALSGAIVVN